MNVMDDKENCLNTRPASFLETVDDACSGSSPNRFMCSFEVNPTEETNDRLGERVYNALRSLNQL